MDRSHPPFARIGPLAISYARETPVDRPWRKVALERLVSHVAAVLRGVDLGA